jgi:hypothetical protein
VAAASTLGAQMPAQRVRRYSPAEIGKLVAEIAPAHGADVIVMLAVIDVESSFNNLARGDGGTSYGLFQHHVGGAGGSTHESARRFLDPRTSITERAAAFAGVRDGKGAAAVQRPADDVGYAREVDKRIKRMRDALAPTSAASGRKWSPVRDLVRREAQARGLRHTSGDRSRKLTADGNVSDHWQGQAASWADDYVGSAANMRAFKQWLDARGDLKQVMLHDAGSGLHVHVAGYSQPTGGGATSDGMMTVGFDAGAAAGAVASIGGPLGAAFNAARGIAGGGAGLIGRGADAVTDAASGAVDAVADAIKWAVSKVSRVVLLVLLVAIGGALIILGITRASGAYATGES